jgi:phospholipase C
MRSPKPLVLILFLFGLSVGCSSNSSNLSTSGSSLVPSSVTRPASGSPSEYIKNVIVIIQENRSFENFFAGFPDANAPMTGCASPTPPPSGSVRKMIPMRRVHRRSGSGSGCPAGDTQVTLHQDTFENNPDLKHDWDSSLIDCNITSQKVCQMDGFSYWGQKHGQYQAYTYIEQSQIQPYWSMAQQYVLADEMFPTEFGGSFTGHLTLVAGTDDIGKGSLLPTEAEVDFPLKAPDDCDSIKGNKSSYITENPYRQEYRFKGPWPCFNQFNTMAEVLDGAGISWRIYASKKLDAGFWEPFEEVSYVRCATFTPPSKCTGQGQDWKNDVTAPSTNVLSDIQNGTLASVSWVTPSKADSDHPGDGPAGPSWVSSVVNAIGNSSYWNQSAIIVIWDDWGGFYDNAPPPQLDYRGLGIRVPCLIVSPYAKSGYVDHTQYEYGSILHFIEEVYGLPGGSIGPTSEGYTDGRGASLDNAFDFTQKARKFVRIAAPYSEAHFLHEPPSDAPVDTE